MRDDSARNARLRRRAISATLRDSAVRIQRSFPVALLPSAAEFRLRQAVVDAATSPHSRPTESLIALLDWLSRETNAAGLLLFEVPIYWRSKIISVVLICLLDGTKKHQAIHYE
jgi:hypothetical protein